MKQPIIKAAVSWAVAIVTCWWIGAASAQTATNYSYSFSPNRAVPDGDFSGLPLKTNLTGMSGYISKVTVSVDITGGFNGDLYAYLAGPNGGLAILLNRPGVGNSNAFGYDDAGFSITFDDSASFNNVHFYQNSSYSLNGGGQLTDTWSSDGRAIDPRSDASVFSSNAPSAFLSSLNGTDPNGTWTLFLADLSGGGQSTVVNWGLTIETVPEPSADVLLGTGVAIILCVRKRAGNAA